MRALSDETLALIAELHRGAGSGVGPAPSFVVMELLATIASTGEPEAIPRIISLVLDPRRDIAEAAADAVKTLLDLVEVPHLGMFDRTFRDRSEWSESETANWIRIQPLELRAVASLRAGATVLQLAMCHPNGHVREEAIRRSATCADGSEVRFLLLRANDWVEPVRELAQSALRARLSVEHVPDLVAAMPILDAMRRWGRLRGTILDEIEQLLGDPRSVPGLIAAAKSRDRFVRRCAFRRLFEDSRPPRETLELFAAALNDPDPRIRTWAAHRLVDAPAEVFLEFADRLRRDRVVAVRVGAVRRLLAAGAELPWPELMMDPNADVRALAQQAILDAGKDPDAEYRGYLPEAHGARLGIVLLGLSETGGPSDAALVRGYLASEVPAVRKSALQALAGFKVDDLGELALVALLDGSPSVTRVARELLLARISSLRGADVWSAFERATSAASKRASLAVLAGLGFWERLGYLLRAHESGDAAVQARVSSYVTRWLLRVLQVYDRPPATLTLELQHLLAASTLPADLRRAVGAAIAARGTT